MQSRDEIAVTRLPVSTIFVTVKASGSTQAPRETFFGRDWSPAWDINGRETTGRLYKAFWYVPEVKRWVRSIEEDCSSTGVRNARYTMELETFQGAAQ